MRGVLAFLAGTALAFSAAAPASAAQLIGGSTISIGGPVIANNADASLATALDFTTGNTSNGSAPGALTLYNGGSGSFAGMFCSSSCGTINDIASLVLGASVTPFFSLTSGAAAGVTYNLSSITFIDRSVPGILGFKGTGTFTGSLGGTAFDATPGSFVFTTQGGNITTFSATAQAVPEPGTWGLMLLGFGAVGFAMRRRRTTVLAQVA